MTSLSQAIRQKEAEIARLTDELATLRKAANILANKDGNAANGDGNFRMMLTSPEEDHMTHPAMAELILRDNTKPLHVTDIVSRIEKKFGRKVLSSSMTTILFKYSDRGKTFYKVPKLPNTYGLLAWNLPPAPWVLRRRRLRTDRMADDEVNTLVPPE